mmetsp:Transcript_26047/g.43897  ORF Transcript_26047/g.43897 Transcript_26047/m.43897 type:complete len:253 (-) Transcript_26047:31-789(-)
MAVPVSTHGDAVRHAQALTDDCAPASQSHGCIQCRQRAVMGFWTWSELRRAQFVHNVGPEFRRRSRLLRSAVLLSWDRARLGMVRSLAQVSMRERSCFLHVLAEFWHPNTFHNGPCRRPYSFTDPEFINMHRNVACQSGPFLHFPLGGVGGRIQEKQREGYCTKRFFCAAGFRQRHADDGDFLGDGRRARSISRWCRRRHDHSAGTNQPAGPGEAQGRSAGYSCQHRSASRAGGTTLYFVLCGCGGRTRGEQ